MYVIINIDSDNDFRFNISSHKDVEYCSIIYDTLEDAVEGLQSFKVTTSYSWYEEGKSFRRVKEINPKEHFFYEFIKLGIASVLKGEDFSIGGNQTLEIDIC